MIDYSRPAKFVLASAARLLLVLLSTFPAVVQAQFNHTTNNGTLTITGYTGPGGAVAIPSTINGLAVTRIGNGAFQSVTRIAAIDIPSGVVSIGSSAFYGCSALTRVTITNGLAVIGGRAFQDCTSLTNITIPSSVTNFGEAMFQSCTKLETVNIPDRISTLPTWTFVFCSSLRSITIPTNITSIQGQAFRDCSSLTSITIPNSVTNIEASAFSGCTNMTTATIPNSVISIEAQAFYNCGLTNVSIPASVIDIEMQAFVGNALSSIAVDTENPLYASAGGVLFNKSGTTLIQFPRGKAGSDYTIPDGVTAIGIWAFDGCSGLTKVIIPASVISLDGYGFYGCTKLTATYFLGSSPNIYYGTSTFSGANQVIVYYMPGTFGWGPTFSGRPTALWNPQVQTAGANFGVQTNRFGFTIGGTSGLKIVVEACTNLTDPIWSPVGTNTLIGGLSYFNDPQWTNYRARLYRIRSP